MTDVRRDCLQCGESFVGRSNRRYCSTACKHREKRRAQRLRELQAELEHTERRVDLARRTHDVEGVRFFGWRARQLRSDLSLENRGEKRGMKRGAKSLPDGAPVKDHHPLNGGG